MEFPVLRVFKKHVNVAFRDMVYGECGSAGLEVGFNEGRGLFQPKLFHDSPHTDFVPETDSSTTGWGC